MKRFLPVLLAAFAVTTFAQEPPGNRAEQARQESVAMATRTQGLQKQTDDRRASGYAENRQRCETALKAAAQRGKVPTFSCGERGFQAKR
jgi:hypothetical protein